MYYIYNAGAQEYVDTFEEAGFSETLVRKMH